MCLYEQFCYSIQFIFQSQIIGYHRDKLAICGLAAVVLNRVSEIGVKGIDVASVPCDLYCVADSALDTACRCLIFFSDRRIQNLCDGIYNKKTFGEYKKQRKLSYEQETDYKKNSKRFESSEAIEYIKSNTKQEQFQNNSEKITENIEKCAFCGNFFIKALDKTQMCLYNDNQC